MAIMGIIRAIGAAIKKVTFRSVRVKASPIIRGAVVIPSRTIVRCIPIKPARCSKGATDTAMIRWLGKFSPWAIPKRIVGNRQSHRLDTKGIITMATACMTKAPMIRDTTEKLLLSLPTWEEVIAVRSPTREINRPIVKGEA